MILWGWGEWDVWGGGEWALQWLALASSREEARGRIISFLLMSSTSWEEGGGAITLLLFSSFPPCPLMAVAAATGLTVTYCIIGVTQEPAHRSILLALPLSRVYQQRQMPCCKSFHRDEFLIHLFFFLFFVIFTFLPCCLLVLWYIDLKQKHVRACFRHKTHVCLLQLLSSALSWLPNFLSGLSLLHHCDRASFCCY